MPKFRHKPIEIDAVQWLPEDAQAVAQMQKFLGNDYFNHGGILRFRAPDGTTEAHAGEWIIRTAKDEFFRCEPEPFAETYEPVTEPTRCPGGCPHYLEFHNEQGCPGGCACGSTYTGRT